MQEETKGIVDALTAIFGPAAVSLVAAAVGRLMYHTGEVKAKRRKLFGRELIWEVPVAVGMAFVGEGVAAYLQLDHAARTATIAVLAYLGPRGAEALLSRVLTGKSSKD